MPVVVEPFALCPVQLLALTLSVRILDSNEWKQIIRHVGYQ